MATNKVQEIGTTPAAATGKAQTTTETGEVEKKEKSIFKRTAKTTGKILLAPEKAVFWTAPKWVINQFRHKKTTNSQAPQPPVVEEQPQVTEEQTQQQPSPAVDETQPTQNQVAPPPANNTQQIPQPPAAPQKEQAPPVADKTTEYVVQNEDTPAKIAAGMLKAQGKAVDKDSEEYKKLIEQIEELNKDQLKTFGPKKFKDFLVGATIKLPGEVDTTKMGMKSKDKAIADYSNSVKTRQNSAGTQTHNSARHKQVVHESADFKDYYDYDNTNSNEPTKKTVINKKDGTALMYVNAGKKKDGSIDWQLHNDSQKEWQRQQAQQPQSNAEAYHKLQQEFTDETNHQGWIGKIWDATKSNLGASSSKSTNIFTKVWSYICDYDNSSQATQENLNDLSNNVNNNEAFAKAKAKTEERITNYKESQKNGVDFVADVTSGIVALSAYSAAAAGLAAAPFTGGSSLLITAGALAVATGTGSATKVTIKYLDAKTGGRDYNTGWSDTGTGAINGLLAPITVGAGGAVGKTIVTKAGTKLGVEIIEQGAKVAVTQGAKEAVEGQVLKTTGKSLIGLGNKYGGNIIGRGVVYTSESGTAGAIYGGVNGYEQSVARGHWADGEAVASTLNGTVVGAGTAILLLGPTKAAGKVLGTARGKLGGLRPRKTATAEGLEAGHSTEQPKASTLQGDLQNAQEALETAQTAHNAAREAKMPKEDIAKLKARMIEKRAEVKKLAKQVSIENAGNTDSSVGKRAGLRVRSAIDSSKGLFRRLNPFRRAKQVEVEPVNIENAGNTDISIGKRAGLRVRSAIDSSRELLGNLNPFRRAKGSTGPEVLPVAEPTIAKIDYTQYLKEGKGPNGEIIKIDEHYGVGTPKRISVSDPAGNLLETIDLAADGSISNRQPSQAVAQRPANRNNVVNMVRGANGATPIIAEPYVRPAGQRDVGMFQLDASGNMVNRFEHPAVSGNKNGLIPYSNAEFKAKVNRGEITQTIDGIYNSIRITDRYQAMYEHGQLIGHDSSLPEALEGLSRKDSSGWLWRGANIANPEDRISMNVNANKDLIIGLDAFCNKYQGKIAYKVTPTSTEWLQRTDPVTMYLEKGFNLTPEMEQELQSIVKPFVRSQDALLTGEPLIGGSKGDNGLVSGIAKETYPTQEELASDLTLAQNYGENVKKAIESYYTEHTDSAHPLHASSGMRKAVQVFLEKLRTLKAAAQESAAPIVAKAEPTPVVEQSSHAEPAARPEAPQLPTPQSKGGLQELEANFNKSLDAYIDARLSSSPAEMDAALKAFEIAESEFREAAIASRQAELAAATPLSDEELDGLLIQRVRAVDAEGTAAETLEALDANIDTAAKVAAKVELKDAIIKAGAASIEFEAAKAVAVRPAEAAPIVAKAEPTPVVEQSHAEPAARPEVPQLPTPQSEARLADSLDASKSLEELKAMHIEANNTVTEAEAALNAAKEGKIKAENFAKEELLAEGQALRAGEPTPRITAANEAVRNALREVSQKELKLWRAQANARVIAKAVEIKTPAAIAPVAAALPTPQSEARLAAQAPEEAVVPEPVKKTPQATTSSTAEPVETINDPKTGRIEKEIHYLKDGKKIHYTLQYEYSPTGVLEKTTKLSSQGKLLSETEYNAKGKPSILTQYERYSDETIVNSKVMSKTKYLYNEAGKLETTIEDNSQGNFETTTRYNPGTEKPIQGVQKNGSGSRSIIDYNADGEMFKTTQYWKRYGEDKLNPQSIKIYDPKTGRIIRDFTYVFGKIAVSEYDSNEIPTISHYISLDRKISEYYFKIDSGFQADANAKGNPIAITPTKTQFEEWQKVVEESPYIFDLKPLAE